MSTLSREFNQLTLVNLEDKPAAFFKGLIRASSTAIVISDALQDDNPIAWANPAFEAMTGYALAEVIGRNCRFLQNSDRGQPELAGMREAIAAGHPYTCTLRNYRKDGSQFWSRMHLFPVRDTGGAITNFAAFLEDVSVANQAQAEVAYARERLGTVLDSISDGCFSLDHDWRFTYINSKGAAWLAREPEELLGKNMWDEFPEGVGGPFHKTYLRALERQEYASCESYYEPLASWIEIRVYPSKDGLTVFFANITERKEAEARLVHMATHDSLTGLHNRFSCLRALDEALARDDMVGVLFIDLDHFKEVNDAHGHQSGDLALQEIGRRMAAFEDEDTTVARISGDEFVFVLTNAEPESAKALAAAVLQRMAEPIAVDHLKVTVGASIGIALGKAREHSADELLNNADAAMYAAKANGRHTFSVFSPASARLIKERLSLRQEVFSALERRQFVLYYQPQISAANGAVVGAEALLRWDHPTLGVLAPGMFLSMLEDSPAITAVGAWVCEEACRQAREWELLGYRLQMAVNVSARQLTDENLPLLLKNLVAHYGLHTECIKLEVTESMLTQDIGKAAAVLRSLQQEGFRIALDDFGTGYSNLSYLRQFPITAIKIDRSFVQEIEQDRRCLDIVNGVIAFAKSLKLAVICEGIETEAQASAIRSTECDVLQGYLIGKPMRASEFQALLLAQSATPQQADPGCEQANTGSGSPAG
ncbi:MULTISPECIES: GGDEF and EAL domain-containing protein [unclassified Massilia]|uniref:GGDEF and EAL domain-containing protein n=1 Tax=unclassified Massilia TaxID=2609279 RepID=UPI000760EFC1|nr:MULTISPECIES: GGDEF and EAL domain-containing protein [unclassified Massilia]